jgi:RNA polymerase sigma factor (TIGR02999 family)
MTKPDATAVTQLLHRLGSGEKGAEAQLFDVLYGELHQNAGHLMRRQAKGHTLQPTALVNEAYLRLVGQQERQWQGRSHFVRVASRAMRSVLVDHVRRKQAGKRGTDPERVPLDDVAQLYEDSPLSVLAVDEAVTSLLELDEQLGRIFELRFFGGLSISETAQALEVSAATVERGWRTARSWLLVRLGEDGSS